PRLPRQSSARVVQHATVVQVFQAVRSTDVCGRGATDPETFGARGVDHVVAREPLPPGDRARRVPRPDRLSDLPRLWPADLVAEHDVAVMAQCGELFLELVEHLRRAERR